LTSKSNNIKLVYTCGGSSAGRTSPCQGEGRRSESGPPLQIAPGGAVFVNRKILGDRLMVGPETLDLVI
jgi:hypothetical protein